jgi:hypothetical protein
MVQRTEVVKAAEQRAYEIVDAAQADARRLRHEVEDFCDQKLASFEIVLERTQKLVAAGRSKLQGTNRRAEAAAAAAAEGALTDDDHEVDVMTSGHPSGGGAVGDPSAYSDSDTYGDAHTQAAFAADPDYYDDEDLDDDPQSERRSRQGRLQVVDDRFSDLPPPPQTQSETLRDAAATFFDQDLA